MRKLALRLSIALLMVTAIFTQLAPSAQATPPSSSFYLSVDMLNDPCINCIFSIAAVIHDGSGEDIDASSDLYSWHSNNSDLQFAGGGNWSSSPLIKDLNYDGASTIYVRGSGSQSLIGQTVVVSASSQDGSITGTISLTFVANNGVPSVALTPFHEGVLVDVTPATGAHPQMWDVSLTPSNVSGCAVTNPQSIDPPSITEVFRAGEFGRSYTTAFNPDSTFYWKNFFGDFIGIVNSFAIEGLVPGCEYTLKLADYRDQYETDAVIQTFTVPLNGIDLQKVTLDANGGTFSLLGQSNLTAGTYSVISRYPSPVFPSAVKGDSEFLGWFSTPTGGTKFASGGESKTVSSTLHLYAHYSGDGNGDSAPTENNVTPAPTTPVESPEKKQEEAKSTLLSNVSTGLSLSLSQLTDAGFGGITQKITDQLNKELSQQQKSNPTFADIKKLIIKISTIESLVNADTASKVSARQLIDIGLIPSYVSQASLLTFKLKKLPSEQIGTYADAQKAIEIMIKEITNRTARLNLLRQRISKIR